MIVLGGHYFCFLRFSRITFTLAAWGAFGSSRRKASNDLMASSFIPAQVSAQPGRLHLPGSQVFNLDPDLSDRFLLEIKDFARELGHFVSLFLAEPRTREELNRQKADDQDFCRDLTYDISPLSLRDRNFLSCGEANSRSGQQIFLLIHIGTISSACSPCQSRRKAAK